MPYCAVVDCKNSNTKSDCANITFHRFPSNSKIRNAWIHRCKRDDDFNISNARICSVHFHQSDFVRDLKNELLDLPTRRILKPDAIPCIAIPTIPTICETPETTSRTERAAKRQRSQLLQELLEQQSAPAFSNTGNEEHCNEPVSDNNNLQTENVSLKQEIEQLQKILLERENEIKRLNYLISQLQQDAKKFTTEKHEIEVASKVLKEVFTKAQIRSVCKKTRVRWAQEDIIKSATLRAISKKAYNFLTKNLRYPAPSLSTIRRWTRCINLIPGVIQPVLHVMKTKGALMSKLEKQCIINFDEMKLDPRKCYDEKNDIVYSHEYVQVVMIRGLMCSWKQPIFFDFDCTLTKELYFHIVKEVTACGFDVVATVCDVSDQNRGLLKSLGVTSSQSYIQNPYSDKKIYFFADVPHLIKLLRNHLLDEGIELPGKHAVNKKTYEQLLVLDEELKLCFKLTAADLDVEKSSQQQVSSALNLFDFSVSEAMLYLLGDDQAANFVKIVHNFWLVMNSRQRLSQHHQQNEISNGFGLHEEQQNECLNKMSDLCESMKVGRRRKPLPFQDGILMSISSLRGLFADMKTLNVTYILTSRLHQDALENFFGQLRGLGSFYDHPLPTDFIQRLKTLLISKDFPVDSIYKNSDSSDNDLLLTASVLNYPSFTLTPEETDQ